MRKDCLLAMFVQFDNLMVLVRKVIYGIRVNVVHMTGIFD